MTDYRAMWLRSHGEAITQQKKRDSTLIRLREDYQDVLNYLIIDFSWNLFYLNAEVFNIRIIIIEIRFTLIFVVTALN